MSNIWRTLEMSLINFEVNLILHWSRDYVISFEAGKTKFAITNTKPYILVLTASTQNNSKLLQQLKSGFKTATNCNRYQSKRQIRQNQSLF